MNIKKQIQDFLDEREKSELEKFLMQNDVCTDFPISYIMQEYRGFSREISNLHLAAIQRFFSDPKNYSQLPEERKLSLIVALYGCYVLLSENAA